MVVTEVDRWIVEILAIDDLTDNLRRVCDEVGHDPLVKLADTIAKVLNNPKRGEE